MGTRSTITVENDDGTYSSVYCHWDGYLSHNGVILQSHYNSDKLAKKLIKHGDISSLSEKCSKPKGHSYDNQVEGYTVYYGRDRGEKDTQARTIHNLSEIDGQEYDYVWTSGCWHLFVDCELVNLRNAIERDKDDD